MTLRSAALTLALLAACLGGPAFATAAGGALPVTPDASPEARAVLQMLQDLSGKHTLTAQHNFPNTGSRNSEFAARFIGKTPAIFASDFGFARDGDTDSYLARPDIVREASGSFGAAAWSTCAGTPCPRPPRSRSSSVPLRAATRTIWRASRAGSPTPSSAIS